MKKVKIKLNTDLLTYKKGSVITLDCDDNGVPYDNFWFRRMKDSDIDNCIEVFVEQKKSTKRKEDDKK